MVSIAVASCRTMTAGGPQLTPLGDRIPVDIVLAEYALYLMKLLHRLIAEGVIKYACLKKARALSAGCSMGQ